MMFARAAALFAAMMLLLTGHTIAALTSTLDGTVLSTQSDPLSDVTIVLRLGSQTFRTSSNALGTFRFDSLPHGVYSLTATAKGYEPIFQSNISIAAEGRPTVAVVMHLASVSSLAVIGEVTTEQGRSVSTQSAPAIRIPHAELQDAATGRLSDMLAQVPALTPVRPAGGDANAPFALALRGPDPTETLVAVDGHQINTGVTGTFDLSLINPDALQDVELVYGIAPSSLLGPNTIGGAVNIRTLEPSAKTHFLANVSLGSSNSANGSFEITGTRGPLGYALAFGRFVTEGNVQTNGLGNAALEQSALIKTRFSFGSRGGFANFLMLDQTSIKDVSAALSSLDVNGMFTSFAGSSSLAHDVLYGFDAYVPLRLGTLTYRHAQELDALSVTGPAANVSQYFFNYRDAATEDSFQYDRSFSNSSLTAKYSVRVENLNAPFTGGGVSDSGILRWALDTTSPSPSSFRAGQVQRAFAIRYLTEPTPKLHYTAALYSSSFSTFGTSLDPRISFVWTPTQHTAVRASAGTSFQAPQLTALYVPSPLPPPDANGPTGFVGIGNPNLTADRATEYNLGFEHFFGHPATATHVSIDAYQTNLRNSIQLHVPAVRPGYSFPINIGNLIYRGVQAELDRVYGTLGVRVSYALTSAFPTEVPPEIASTTLVVGQQVASVPLHRASFRLDRRGPLSFGFDLVYEGTNNELNRSPFATLSAHVSAPFKSWNFLLNGWNLTNVYADRFTRVGQGVAYPGSLGPVPTDAYALSARTITLSLSKRI